MPHKISLDKDEWYPVYQAVDEGSLFFDAKYSFEVTSGEYWWIVETEIEFGKLQQFLERKYKEVYTK